MPTQFREPWPHTDLHCVGIYTETWVDDPCPTTAHRVEQRMNDTNTNGDGPTRIQTATGGDKPQTAGGTPTTKPTLRAREQPQRSKGVRKKP